MKRSTIKAVIQNKIDKWLETITDLTLAKDLKRHIIVSGGCITSMYLNERVNDYDVYIDDYDILLRLTRYYVSTYNQLNSNKGIEYTPEVKEILRCNIRGEEERRIFILMKSAGLAGETQADQTYSYFEQTSETVADQFLLGDTTFMDSGPHVTEMLKDPVETIENLTAILRTNKQKFNPVFLTDNAITLSDKLQVIIRFYGEPEEIHKNFDYLHATCWYHTKTQELYTPEGAIECMINKQLKYTGSLYPIASVFRMRKFLKRGWNISAGQILKILSQLQLVDFQSIDNLREQLIGVDVAYMTQLIDALNNTTERVDAAYIAKLVDIIFED